MRKMWAAVAGAALMALAPGIAAWASGGPPFCEYGCYAYGGTTFGGRTDYTIPDDGVLYDWSFWSDSAHPDVLISVDPPDETFGLDLISNGDGTYHIDPDGPDPWFTWNVYQQPGSTLVQVRGEPSYNDCGDAPAGALCGYSSNIWGNGTTISVNTHDTVEIFDSARPAIPEPQSWLLMLLGFFGLGTLLRRGRLGRIAIQEV
jgi:hypothetical protein